MLILIKILRHYEVTYPNFIIKRVCILTDFECQTDKSTVTFRVLYNKYILSCLSI